MGLEAKTGFSESSRCQDQNYSNLIVGRKELYFKEILSRVFQV